MNMFITGLVGLAVGVYVGNTMKKGYVTRQGRRLMRRAKDGVEQHMDHWLD